jgi:hypothetical protein
MIKTRKARLAKYVARMEERRRAYRVLVGKPEGKRTLENPVHISEYNINMNLQEVGRRA